MTEDAFGGGGIAPEVKGRNKLIAAIESYLSVMPNAAVVHVSAKQYRTLQCMIHEDTGPPGLTSQLAWIVNNVVVPIEPCDHPMDDEPQQETP